jgi:hypothetical protein
LTKWWLKVFRIVGCVTYLSKKKIFKRFWNSIPVLSLFPSAKSKKSFVMKKKIEKPDVIIRLIPKKIESFKLSRMTKYVMFKLCKALRKEKYSDFCIFAKFETWNIPCFPYIRNILCQNQIFIFTKYLFWLKFQLNNMTTVCKALV